MLLTILVLFVIIFILIIPVDMVFTVSNLENRENSVSVNLIFGLIHYKLYPKKQVREKPKPEKIKPRKKKKGLKLRKILKLSENEKFRGKLAEFIKKILRSIKLKLDRLYIRLGLDDPADTGMLWGFMGPASALLDYYSKTSVMIEPEFQDSALDIDTNGKVSVIPLEIFFISLIFLLSPIIVKTVWLNFARGAE